MSEKREQNKNKRISPIKNTATLKLSTSVTLAMTFADRWQIITTICHKFMTCFLNTSKVINWHKNIIICLLLNKIMWERHRESLRCWRPHTPMLAMDREFARLSFPCCSQGLGCYRNVVHLKNDDFMWFSMESIGVQLGNCCLDQR